MGALLAFAAAAVYVWLAYRLARRSRRPWVKAAIVSAAVLIPTSDAVYGRLKLKQLCQEQGGMKVFKEARNVNGFFMEATSVDEQLLKRTSFKFVESGRRTAGRNVIDRLSRRSDGSVYAEKDVARQSQYSLRFLPGDPADVYMRSDYVVQSIDGQETLARIRNFNYAGGWVERAIAALHAGRASAGTCALNRDTYALQLELLSATLHPN
jgi:hypothetical protein